jgi:hypothetical protein
MVEAVESAVKAEMERSQRIGTETVVKLGEQARILSKRQQDRAVEEAVIKTVTQAVKEARREAEAEAEIRQEAAVAAAVEKTRGEAQAAAEQVAFMAAQTVNDLHKEQLRSGVAARKDKERALAEAAVAATAALDKAVAAAMQDVEAAAIEMMGQQDRRAREKMQQRQPEQSAEQLEQQGGGGNTNVADSPMEEDGALSGGETKDEVARVKEEARRDKEHALAAARVREDEAVAAAIAHTRKEEQAIAGKRLSLAEAAFAQAQAKLDKVDEMAVDAAVAAAAAAKVAQERAVAAAVEETLKMVIGGGGVKGVEGAEEVDGAAELGLDFEIVLPAGRKLGMTLTHNTTHAVRGKIGCKVTHVDEGGAAVEAAGQICKNTTCLGVPSIIPSDWIIGVNGTDVSDDPKDDVVAVIKAAMATGESVTMRFRRSEESEAARVAIYLHARSAVLAGEMKGADRPVEEETKEEGDIIKKKTLRELNDQEAEEQKQGRHELLPSSSQEGPRDDPAPTTIP